ncbi:ABC transporter ATP-binding protein [Arcobacter sp. F2176]|uniref:ABC transporter ATP-binding protein n=1 Tax=Arcobacter sp. F2176 TaxID=2044511 RepID=UPI00100B6645|nr:ABC transporter ATP-binding protein [Arcobacter sp. F2176]RXJ81851.1 ABC transporter ATP-binding protein [Arcobacter sp. F2176]
MSLELENVSMKVDGQTHIYNTNLTLQKGTMNVLLGRTLSGKTTLMRIMAGLDVPTTGKILWEGKDVTRMRVQDRKVAMVYQQFVNYPSMSVYENIAAPLRIMKKDSDEIDKAVRETAALMRLTNMLDRKPLELSGGQQQRCALARSLVKGSGLVLLDEPLANLDYKLREELREEIPKMFEKSGAIFVYATTEPEEALLLGGNVVTLWEGKITQFDETTKVYHRPNTAITAKVFSNPSMNFLNIKKEGDYFYYGDRQKALATNGLKDIKDGKYLAGFRPNHLELTKKSENAIEFSAHLDVTEITGSETFLHMQHKEDNWIGLVHGVHDLEYNSEISVYLDTRHIFVFSHDGDLVKTASYVEER